MSRSALAAGSPLPAAILLGLCFLPLVAWDVRSGPPLMLLGGLTSAALTFSYLSYLRGRLGCAWEAFGLVKPSAGDALWGLGVGLATVANDVVRSKLFPDALLAESNKLPPELAGPAALLALCGMVVGAAFAEELVFRAYMLSAFSARFGRTRALLGVGALFGLFHFPYVGSKTVSALITGVVFLRRRSLWPGFIGHVLHNLVGYGAAYFLLERAAR